MSPKVREAQRSILAAGALAIVKLAVGLASGSLAILAEAANSVLDLFASLITLVAVRFADQPADADHPYGHGKAENLAAFVQSGIILLTCFWISLEAVQRLVFSPAPPVLSPWLFGVMLLSMAVSGWRVRSLRRVAERTQSQALEADALHFYTDLFTGGAVLLGLVAVWLAERLGMPLLARADALAALLVCGVLIHATWEMGRAATGVLLDRSHEMTDHIEAAAGSVPGVERVHRVRTRRVGAESFVDMSIDVARTTPFERSHRIATEVEQAIHLLLPRAHVVVHVDPVRARDESVVQTIHAIARRQGHAVHHVSIHRLAHRVIANLHLELPPHLTLAAAHARADHFERQVLNEIPLLDEVVTHIEPTAERVAVGPDVTERARRLVSLVERVSGEIEGIIDCHDISVQAEGGRHHISMHATFDPVADLQQVHLLMARLERDLRNEVDGLGQIFIHPEPWPGSDGATP